MKRLELPEPDPQTHIPQLVLSMLCDVRNITTDPHDYECYDRAIEAVTKVQALARQRKAALDKLTEFGQQFES